MKKYLFIVLLVNSSFTYAETLTLNCTMNGTIMTTQKTTNLEKVVNRNYVVTIQKEPDSLGIGVDDEKGHPEVTLSWSKDGSIGKSTNQSNNDRYYLFENYGDAAMKTSESVELNRKSGVIGIKKSTNSKNYEMSYYLTGNCSKLEKNKF